MFTSPAWRNRYGYILAIMQSPCFCTNLRQAARKMSAAYDAALAPLNINIAQYSLLRTIAQFQALSLTDLGRIAELERSTVGRNVRVLERSGLVETARSDTDQREALVSLTSIGQDLMRRALPIWEACQQSLVSRVGDLKVETLVGLLSEV